MLEKYLCDKDFIDVSFVDYELRWLTADDFIQFGKEIKQVYKRMNINQKKIYKWYCYANIHTSIYQKNKIWDYLNGDINFAECKISLGYKGNNYREKHENN